MPRLSKARKALLTTVMKESIFEATTAVLCEHGVDGTTMNRVAAAANVAKSSLYDYFSSKDELLEFVSERIAVPFLEDLEQIVRTESSAPKKLAAILRSAFAHVTEHQAILRLLVESNQERLLKTRSRPRLLQAFTTIFEQGIREGSFRPHNPEHTGRMFLGCLAELFELQATNAPEEIARDYVEALIHMSLRGLSIHVESGSG